MRKFILPVSAFAILAAGVFAAAADDAPVVQPQTGAMATGAMSPEPPMTDAMAPAEDKMDPMAPQKPKVDAMGAMAPKTN